MSSLSRGTMTFWYWYLISAASLSLSGYVSIDLFLMSALAVAVHALRLLARPKKPLTAGLKAAAVAAAALALLWRESFLPSAATIFTFLADPVTRPSTRYLLEFVRRSPDPGMLAAGAALLAAALFLSGKKPLLLACSAYFLIGTAWLLQPARDLPNLRGNTPESFYAKESGRVVNFPRPAKGDPPFDIILLHICSLSWKDMRDAGYDPVPFFSEFDYVFTDFSAGGAYSRPAALRLLRSACGQVPQARLSEEAPAGCYMMDELRRTGYATYSMLNHDGRYADFLTLIQKSGRAAAPLGTEGLRPAYKMFDGTLLYTDLSALDKYWRTRMRAKAPRAALYYNTVNLHIGTHPLNGGQGPDSAAAYGERLKAMTAQFKKFFTEVERSGRNAVVILVPEHGAALTGTKLQGRDVREIPFPPISTVPVAVKLIGKRFYSGPKPQLITKPASLLELAWLLAEFLRHNPYTRDAGAPGSIASRMPGTQFLAENDNAAVMRTGTGYIYRNKDKSWAPLPAYEEIPPGTIPAPGDFRKTAGSR